MSLHAMASTSLLDMGRLIFAHTCVWRRAGPSGGIPGPLAHPSHRAARAHNPRHNLFSALGHCSLYRLHLRNLRYVRIRFVLRVVLTLTRYTGRFYSCKHLSSSTATALFVYVYRHTSQEVIGYANFPLHFSRTWILHFSHNHFA